MLAAASSALALALASLVAAAVLLSAAVVALPAAEFALLAAALALGAMLSPAFAVPVMDMRAEDFLPLAADLKDGDERRRLAGLMARGLGYCYQQQWIFRHLDF